MSRPSVWVEVPGADPGVGDLRRRPTALALGTPLCPNATRTCPTSLTTRRRMTQAWTPWTSEKLCRVQSCGSAPVPVSSEDPADPPKHCHAQHAHPHPPPRHPDPHPHRHSHHGQGQGYSAQCLLLGRLAAHLPAYHHGIAFPLVLLLEAIRHALEVSVSLPRQQGRATAPCLKVDRIECSARHRSANLARGPGPSLHLARGSGPVQCQSCSGSNLARVAIAAIECQSEWPSPPAGAPALGPALAPMPPASGLDS